ncbi:MAG: hypothetical protein U1E46_13095 [Hyphomicrobiales bacterium]
MGKPSVQWMGEAGTVSKTATNAFHELDRAHNGELTRRLLADVRAEAPPAWYERPWVTFVAAFVAAFIALQFLPLHTPPAAVMVGKWLADPLQTASP